MSGKGDKQRPQQIPEKEAQARWKLAFERNLSDKERVELEQIIKGAGNVTTSR